MTMFTDEQKQALEAPLDRGKIKTRKQANIELSYIEGWMAIAEANRIFGFDGWTRETVEMVELGQPFQDNKENWRVAYRAKARISVGEIVREGTGFGSGASKNIGDAYEGAIKEAETDALKRALMTFGNQFGLALYDKERSGVAAPEQDTEDNADSTENQVRRKASEIKNQLLSTNDETALNEAWEAYNQDLEWIRANSNNAYKYLLKIAEDHKKTFYAEAG